MRKHSRLFGLAAAAVAVAGLPMLGQAAKADVSVVVDVAAGVSAPPTTSTGAFDALGSITNTGTVSQPAGSTLTYAASGGTLTGVLPGGCVARGASVAVCTVGALRPGDIATYAFNVSSATGVASVGSTVEVKSALVETNVLDPTNNVATTVTEVAYGVDAALTNRPTDVRYAADTLLTSTVTNTKAPQTVNVDLATGGQRDPRIALPAGCASANSGASVNCSFLLGTNQSRTFDVAVTVPASGSSITSTLTATGGSGGTKSVSVVTNLSSDAQAFVPAGDHLTFLGSNQSTDFTVPVGSAPGLFLDLHETTLNNVQCGAGTCIKQAAEAIFPADGEYSGSDPAHPFVWKIKYDERQVCNGNGGGSGCLISIYWIGTGQTTTKPMRLCPTYGTPLAPTLNSVDEPCLQSVQKTTKGYSTYTVALLRDIVIPIISSTSR
ncbi:MAG: hypothetical protein H0U92_07645 [Actinobacteria bacterium]|nr:hypothetical protein [Actinomycetota bacterium]